MRRHKPLPPEMVWFRRWFRSWIRIWFKRWFRMWFKRWLRTSEGVEGHGEARLEGARPEAHGVVDLYFTACI